LPARLRYYLDTNVVISIVEATKAYGAAQARFVKRIDDGEIEVVTSELTLAECLVKPLADRNLKAIEAYLGFLEGRPELSVLPIDRAILLDAARVRAELNIKLPDAIHVATALAARCERFVTSDKGIVLPRAIELARWDQPA
jgi:predicted nucleic acid-binding protein